MYLTCCRIHHKIDVHVFFSTYSTDLMMSKKKKKKEDLDDDEDTD